MPIIKGVLTITPDDIKITKHMFDAFGHYETEVSAEWLVKFAQKRGNGWEPFTQQEIEAFYNSKGLTGFGFNRLIREGHIRDNGKHFEFTDGFIARCYEATR